MGTPLEENEFQEYLEIPFAHAQVTGDTTAKLWRCPAGRVFRVDSVDYINPAGLAADASNYFAVQIKQGSVVVAQHSTLTTAQGVLTADTFVALVKSSTDADLLIEGGEVLSLTLDETGTATLPAGSGVIRGRFVA